jgi:hypothetical protein
MANPILMKDIRKFAAKFPGFNNPSDLPSGSTQLSNMKRPVIVKKCGKCIISFQCFVVIIFFSCDRSIILAALSHLVNSGHSRR